MRVPGQITRRLLLGGIGSLPLVRLAHGQTATRLTILHFNDFHSRHFPVDGVALSCDAEKAGCYGSSPRLASAIREQRRAAEADGRAVLLLDAGDEFQGSMFFTAHKGMAELAVQHAVGVEAMAVGNHEFDDGPATLGAYLDAARFPVVSANLDVSAEPALAGRIKPFVVIEKAGLKIGVVGLTTREAAVSSSPGPRVKFHAGRPALVEGAAAARAAGAQLVLALSHLGLAADRGLDVPGVPLVIGGHSHTLLSNTEPGAAGPAPVMSAGGTAIVQAQAYGRYLGRIDLDVAADGTILALAAACRHIGLDLPEDPEVAAIVARFGAPLEALRQKVVAVLDAPLTVKSCRVAPCPFGEKVAETLRGAVHGAAVGLMNAGGLRVRLPAGPVTLGQVLEALPFGNTLATVTLTGAQLEAVAQHGLTMTGRGGFAQWAGLRWRVVPPGVEVQRADGSWGPIDPDAHYLVATNNFLRNGGDGYTILRDQGQDAYDNGANVADLFAEALARP